MIKKKTNDSANLPFVSVIIPAKNEENNIGTCIDHFLALKDVQTEIIVANDNSTDKTQEILDRYGDKIKVVKVPTTPEGWTGKNHALHHAVPAAKGDWYLFTDADTRHEPHSLRASLEHAKSKQLEFLTLLPRCIAHGFIENMIQPLAMAFLGLWFPIEKINNPKSSVYFANGQYILISKNLYQKLGGHEAVKGAFLEDFALMEKAKKAKAKAECAFGMDAYGTRMYDSLESLWRGWRRIYLHAFRQKPFPLIKRFLGLIIFSVIPFTVFFALLMVENPSQFDQTLTHWFGALLCLVIATSWKAYDMVKAKRIFAFLHPIAATFVALILLDAFWMATTKQKTIWR